VSGLWRLAGDGDGIPFVSREFQPGAVADETEALFLGTVDAGQVVSAGQQLAAALHHGQLRGDLEPVTGST